MSKQKIQKLSLATKGGGYGVSTQHELGWYTLALLQDWAGGEIAFQEDDIIGG